MTADEAARNIRNVGSTSVEFAAVASKRPLGNGTVVREILRRAAYHVPARVAVTRAETSKMKVRISRVSCVVVMLLGVAGSCAAASAPAGDAAPLRLQTVAKTLVRPVFLTHDGTARSFIVEQPGRIR